MLTTFPTPTIPFDPAAAEREGWGVFDCGPSFEGAPQAQLQRLDAPPGGQPAFGDDHAAWMHVVARARAGSALHRAALDAVDDIERLLIRAACGGW